MATPNSSWGDLLSVTLRKRVGKPIDNMSEHNACFLKLKEKGKIKIEDGGYEIVFPIEFDSNSTYSRIDGYDEFSITPSEVFSSVVYPWKQVVVSVTASQKEILQNANRNKIIDLLKGRIANAERTFQNNLDSDFYSDGTASGGKQVGGLQLLVSALPSGSSVVGGINQATYSFWRNTAVTATTTAGFGATVDATNAEKYTRKMLYLTSFNGSQPDLALLSNDYFDAMVGAVSSRTEIPWDKKMLDYGFKSIKYLGVDLVNAEMANGHLPSTYNYFLNTNELYCIAHKDANWVELEGAARPLTQAAIVKSMTWFGNLVCTERRSQGLFINA